MKKKGRGDSEVQQRGRGSRRKNSHAPYFLSQEQGRERAGGGVGGGGGGCMWGEKSELYFFGCLERAQRSSSTRTRCNKTLRDEVSDRGRQGRERRNERGCSQASRTKAREEVCMVRGEEGVRLGSGQQMHEGYFGCWAMGVWQLREPELAKLKRLQPNDKHHHIWMSRENGELFFASENSKSEGCNALELQSITACIF